MPLNAADLELIRQTVQEVVGAAQEKLAQMVAKQSMEMRTHIQDIQDSIRKSGNRQVQLEADIADVGRTCESLKRRVQELHLDLTETTPDTREVTHRLDHLEREVAEIRQRLSASG